MTKCEGAPWCLMPAMEGSNACRLHTELPAKTLYTHEGLVSVEDAEKWKTRYRRLQKAKRDAAVKQAESDDKLKGRT